MWLMWFLAIAVPLMGCLGGALSGMLPEATKARYAESYYRWFRWSVYLNLCGWSLLLATMLWLPEHLMQAPQARLQGLEQQVSEQLASMTHQTQRMALALEEIQARQLAPPRLRRRWK